MKRTKKRWGTWIGLMALLALSFPVQASSPDLSAEQGEVSVRMQVGCDSDLTRGGQWGSPNLGNLDCAGAPEEECGAIVTYY